jgi:hypothetical protein
MRKAFLAGVPLAMACVATVVLLRGCDEGKGFNSLEECREWAAGKGYRVSSGVYTLWITDNPDIHFGEMNVLRIPPRCAYLRMDASEVAEQIPGEPTRWGKVYVWGDREFLAELESR